MLAACTPAAVVPASSEIATDYLFYRQSDDAEQASAGGLAKLWVDVEPNPRLRAPVRFAETVSGGVGEAWRATVWMALLAAGEIMDVDPFSLRVTVEAEGAVDGPSAGALMAAAIMAGARRAPVRTDVTITGTLNPDLTVGPVGGIPEKVEAAIRAGKKVIGIPMGQRRSQSLTKKVSVDVVAMAEKAGARIAIVPDLESAYNLLTGQSIPTTAPLDREDMALPIWISDVFADRAKSILRSVLAGHTDFRRFTKRLDDKKAKQRQAITRRLMKLAQKRLAKGDGVGAMDAATEAHRNHHALRTKVLTRVGAQFREWSTLRDLLLTLRTSVHFNLERSVPRWKKHTPGQAAEVPFAVETFEAMLDALRGLAQGDRSLESAAETNKLLAEPGYRPPKKEVSALIRGMQKYSTYLVDAQSSLVFGKAYLDVSDASSIRTGRTGVRPISEEVLKRVAARYERVADANLEYVDALLSRPLAARLNEPVERIRERLLLNDADYRTAYMNRRLPSLLSNQFINGLERRYAEVSGAVSSYIASGTVISKRYSLGAVYSRSDHTLLGVRQTQAFESMVKLADRRARQVAAQCLDVLGKIPTSALIEYHLAAQLERDGRTLRRRDAGAGFRMRMKGLVRLWRVWTLGRLALTTHRYLLASSDRRPPFDAAEFPGIKHRE